MVQNKKSCRESQNTCVIIIFHALFPKIVPFMRKCEQFCRAVRAVHDSMVHMFLLKLVCYTCGLTTLETRYSYFSYMHFFLICTVVVLYCFVVCV